MSCRDTPGNSAVTSYARLAATGAVSDNEVQQVFHDLKRRHKQIGGDHKPDAGEVTGFLDHQAWTVRNDATLSPVRKHSLLERLSRARVETLDPSRVPDMATFRAWQDLHVEVEIRTQYRHLRSTTSTRPVDPDEAQRLHDRLG